MGFAENLLTILVLGGFGFLIYYSMQNKGSLSKIRETMNKVIAGKKR